MKKSLTFLLLLCAVSCSQTKPKPAFQESLPGAAGLLPNHSPNGAAPASPTEGQFNPGRTNVVAVIPVDEQVPVARAATDAPALPASVAPLAPAPAEEMIPAGTINFTGADLKEVLKIYCQMVNRTVLQPAGLPNPQIILKTETALTKRELIQALEAVFSLNGISLVNVGEKFVKVIPAAQAHTEGGANDTRSAAELPDLGQYLTHVVQLKYTKPSEMVPALQPFAKLNSLLPMDNNQILIIRDYTENVKRMLEMVEQIDVNVPSEFVSEVIPIKYAKAGEMAEALNSLGAGGGGGGSVGARTSTTRGATRAGGAPGALNNRAGGVGGFGGGAASYGGVGGIGGQAGGIGGAVGGTPTSFTDRLNKLITKASSSGDLQLFGQMKMIADERSNSLLIFATRSDMEMIKSVIARLDVVLAQVLIETAIVDVNIDKDLNFGVTAGQVPKTNSFGSIGGVYNNSKNPLATLATFLGGQVASNSSTVFPVGDGLNYFGRYNGNIDVAVNALASNSRGNVVQRPQILTTHATPGSIFVGDTVPYITSTYQGGQFGGSSSYQQLQVGISLTVTPFINQDGLVVMQIDETIDGLNGNTIIDGNPVPKTTSRKLSAEVAVRDGETIILGGFIKNTSDKSATGVPILKDIPLLGALFTSRNESKKRSELVVLMRPTVLKTPEIAAQKTTELKNTLPGVLRAEAEIQADVKKQLDEDRKAVRAEQIKAAKRRDKLSTEEKAYDDSQAK